METIIGKTFAKKVANEILLRTIENEYYQENEGQKTRYYEVAVLRILSGGRVYADRYRMLDANTFDKKVMSNDWKSIN